MLTPSLSFVVLGALHDGVTVWDRAADLPGYLSDTFLHLRLGDAPRFQKSLHDVVLEGLPVDVALLVGGTALGVAIGLATGLASGARQRSGVDRALSVGSTLGLSAPCARGSTRARVRARSGSVNGRCLGARRGVASPSGLGTGGKGR